MVDEVSYTKTRARDYFSALDDEALQEAEKRLASELRARSATFESIKADIAMILEETGVLAEVKKERSKPTETETETEDDGFDW